MTQVFKDNKDRLPERHEYLSVLASCLYKLQLKRYNTVTQMHTKNKKEKKEEKKTTSMQAISKVHVMVVHNPSGYRM